MSILNNFDLYLSKVSFFTFILAFIGGVLVSFTPCVYPLLPLTIGYIGSRSIGSKLRGFFLSFFYVFGFALVYSLLGLGAVLTGKVFGEFLQSFLGYFIVGNLCLFLSLSLFDLWELPIPKFLREKRFERKGKSFLGAILIGMASALIASPCTTPVLGSILLFVAMERNIILGVSLLFVFAYGMGLLLILVGTFSGILAGLPKAGVWMVKIKKIFAWFLLIFGEYYLLKAGSLL